MRISGLASGMDIDAMVKQLMTAQKVPLNKLNQQKQQMEWKRDGYRQVSTSLVNFNQKLSTYSLSSSIDSKKATVTGASNVLTATTNGTATNSVLNISVGNLASATTVVSSGATAKPSSDAKISTIYNSADLTNSDPLETSIEINGVPVQFTADDTIASLVNKINNNKATGVTAVYDSSSGKMSLTNRETGANKDITVTGELLTKVFGFATPTKTDGQDATVIINGLTTKQANNRFTVNGVEISLTGKTPVGETTQIEVSQDIDKMVDTIKSFVESYNATLATLNQKISEERYRTYLPLTTEQRADMKEDEITLWESKAKSGMLKNDSIIDQTVSNMRAAMISEVTAPDGSKVNMTQFGITTGNYSEKGKLYIDETKLRAALESNPDGAAALFGQTDNTSSTKYSDKDGLFSRMKKVNSASLTLLSDKAGTSRYSTDLTTAFLPQSQIGEQLRAYETRISDLQARLTMVENRYYKQFTAMETAMNKYNSASSSLTSMFS